MNATDFEKQWGIPAERVPLTGSSNADRAVEARRKAGDMRHIAAIAGTTEWAPLHPPVNLNDGRLPTAALEWPIYVAAYTQSTEDCESRGHREYAYGPPDITESEQRAMHGDR